MKKYFPFLLLLLLLSSCAETSTKTLVTVSTINNGKALQITGFDPAIINEISRDSSAKAWETLMAVYRMPADTSMRNLQPAQPGSYTIHNNVVVFTPDTAFSTQQTYFFRYYDFSAGSTLTDLIKSRSKPGALHYTDLIFKQ
ncbi:hypothetical protein DIU31_027095 [Mucilaginibacter rubeus]|uniref:Lipoprotein n=1 Tax=Mucilaginibacter rubeus TaxID=2027860 RepID=A0AAE6MKN3_9SPHI|nr:MULTISPECIES: hypothetical protein [Mucilaginibacter]QEM06993.1 hypothetical protein DIU31_027095 [Mucilaginibacter rubeus]QEM19581.1 hypothetical protein DIU38_027390 [Mucilaginibacter gossypii]QTE43865.1 hypothetical protein J3L19_00335 [Mucilaginibacter rubeus]QTE50466.1 hypothetical protein J3L21_00320 [Mucilaginibacter rubeus]QTE55551.1 hypothetical protein J3L23_25555 [Mucilaginibacter rubeus]